MKTPDSAHLSVAAAIFISVALCIYVVQGAQFPRPLWFMIAISLSMGLIIMSATLVNPDNGTEVIYLFVSGLIVSTVSKSSNLLIVISSGIDHGRWLERVQTISEVGRIVGSDMYKASPIYILELSIPNIIFGDGIAVTTTRFVTVLISIIFPIIIYAVVKSITQSQELGFLGFALTISQPLLFRTAMLLESEILAMVWYSISLLSLITAIRTQQTRWIFIAGLFLTSSILLHFFYGFITITTIFIMFIIIAALIKMPIFAYINSPVTLKTTVTYVLVFALIFAPFWVFGSIYRHEAVSVLSSVLFIGDIHSLIPAEGSAAAGTGSGNGSSNTIKITLLRYAPIFGFVVLGTIGGLHCLISRRWAETSLAILSMIVALLAITIVVLGIEFQLGFRLYYYVMLCLLILSPIGIDKSLQMFHKQKWVSRLQSILYLFIIITIVSTAPISPLANNIDPVAGGQEWYILPAESQASETMDRYVNGNVPLSSDLIQHSGYFRPHSSENDPARMTRDLCMRFESHIYTNGYLMICR